MFWEQWSILRMSIKKIEELLLPYINLPLECDGMCKVLSYVLYKNNITHEKCYGEIKNIKTNKSIYHEWILWDDHIIDYKAKLWFKGSGVPNGIFKFKEDIQDRIIILTPTKFKNFEYYWHKSSGPFTNKTIFMILGGTMNENKKSTKLKTLLEMDNYRTLIDALETKKKFYEEKIEEYQDKIKKIDLRLRKL